MQPVTEHTVRHTPLKLISAHVAIVCLLVVVTSCDTHEQATALRSARAGAIHDEPSTVSPSVERKAFPLEVRSNGGTYVLTDVQVASGQIALSEPFSFSFAVEEAAGRFPLSGDQFSVACDAVMPSHNHGMNYEPKVVVDDHGLVTVTGCVLHMKGDWQVHIDITRDHVTERVQWNVTL